MVIIWSTTGVKKKVTQEYKSTASSGRIFNEQGNYVERMWKETVVTQCEALSWDLPGGT